MNLNQNALLLEEAGMLGRIIAAVGLINGIILSATYGAVILINLGIVLLLLRYAFIDIDFDEDSAEVKRAKELLRFREFIYGALAISVATNAFAFGLPVAVAFTLIFTTFVVSWARLADI
jgi:hypothetical protein